MNKEENVKMLQDVRKNVTDPAMKKDLDKKIEALKNDKTVNK